MLLSLRELIVWTGLGPFEVALHSFSLLVFTLLVTLRLELEAGTSWHAIFSPLYVALGLHAYFLAVLSSRMVAWEAKKSRNKALVALVIVCGAFGIGFLLYAEYSVANYLNGGSDGIDQIIASFSLLATYLFARSMLLLRTVTS